MYYPRWQNERFFLRPVQLKHFTKFDRFVAYQGLSLKPRMGNRGIRDSGNRGIWESENPGIGNLGIRESGKEIMKIHSLLTPVKHMIFQRQVQK